MVDPQQTHQTAEWIAEKFGYRFNEIELMQRALTHRSVAGINNERLEFLGDAVLDCVISEFLLQLRPDADEGELSRLRSRLVRDRSLGEIGVNIGIGDHIHLGTGERRSGGCQRSSILADATEAMLGAIFLDGGYSAVRAVVQTLYLEQLDDLPDDGELKDAKTLLQEWLQARGKPLPQYDVVATSGRPHKQTFEVRCLIPESDIAAVASGSSRRKAEQASAELVLAELLAGDSNVLP